MIAPARLVSWRILLKIATTDAHSDDLLRAPEVNALSAPDRHLTTTLVLGTLRWQLALDARIRPLLARPEGRLSPEVETALRMGAYQLHHLDRVPVHAVLNDSVELVKQSRERGAAGMVNAVLRKLAAQSREGIDHQPGVSAEQIAAFTAHPSWMVERWAHRYGLPAAEAICRWNQAPPPLSLRVEPGETDLSSLEVEPGVLLSCARRIVRGDLGPVLRAGHVRVQDEGSQLVAEIAAAAAAISAGGKVLDACAAPGGKTAILAARLPAAEITVLDVSRKRLDTMRALLGEDVSARLGFQVGDAAALRLEPEYALILCDVPCSGTGTIARNPEIRFRVDEPELARQHGRQAAILRAALGGLAPAGRLVYSTCSLEPEENESVVEETLKKLPGFQILPIEPVLDQLALRSILTPAGRATLATDGAFLRTIPGLHPCDGFFAALLARL
jgi:16S rRNA (cytosine967-C5)-methyltransferase